MEEEEVEIFDYYKFYNENIITLLKQKGFYDPITLFGQSMKKYKFPIKKNKKNVFDNIYLKKN